MTLAAGQTLTHYEILGPIGAGGMGEVYRARDTRLEREVAIKVLPERFADDLDRMKRFEREAKTLASLNHTNVAGIYGIDQVGDTCFLAMELVPGEDLADRLARGRLPIDEAIGVCRQIAEGLEAAHEAGVVHRDLKPANVRITPEAVVKILDFGLAKPVHPKSSKDGTTTAETDSFLVTEEGLVLGTPTYMSPEQARGRPVDRRSDVWAFGCVLYECLTGRRAFEGATLSDVIAAVLDKEPELAALPAGTPPSVRALLVRCLDKDPRRRLRDVGEARVVLESPDAAGLVSGEQNARGGPGGLLLASAALALLALGWFAGARGRGVGPAAEEREPVRFVLPQRDELGSPAISHDGRWIAFAQERSLWVRALSELAPRRVAGTEGGTAPFWSPDGEALGFVADGRMWHVPRSGGERLLICELEGGWTDAGGAVWGSDGSIVFTTGDSGLLRVSARGGNVEDFLPTAADEFDFHSVRALPGGRGFLYVLHRADGDRRSADTIVAYDGKQRHVIVRHEGNSLNDPAWSPTGHVLYNRLGSNAGLWAVPVSLDTLAPTGDPVLFATGGSAPSISDEGTLVYVPGTEGRMTQLAWLDREGQVLQRFEPPRLFNSRPALSPDGKYAVCPARTNNRVDLWLHDLESGTSLQLTSVGDADFPSWSPDGRWIVFSGLEQSEGDVRVVDARAAGEVRSITTGLDPVFDPRGERLYFARRKDNLLSLLTCTPEGQDERILFSEDARAPELSPAGDLLAFAAWETGRFETFVRDLSGSGGRWKISTGGGLFPRWSDGGKKLAYVSGRDVYEVEVGGEGGVPRFSPPRRLFALPPQPTTMTRFDSFDVSPDGERFLTTVGLPGEELADQITVVLGFPELMRRLEAAVGPQ